MYEDLQPDIILVQQLMDRELGFWLEEELYECIYSAFKKRDTGYSFTLACVGQADLMPGLCRWHWWEDVHELGSALECQVSDHKR